MTTKPAPRTGHPYYMHDAVHGQPSAIARVLTEERASVEAAARLLGSARRIHLVGIGTSWHAALIGEYLLRTVAGREDARAWNSFEFAVDGPALDSGDAVVVLTHTGRKCYSVQALGNGQVGRGGYGARDRDRLCGKHRAGRGGRSDVVSG